MEPILILLISALAGARIWRLLAVDDIGMPFRNGYYRIFNKDGWYEWADGLLTCPFCMGFWVTAVVFITGILSSGCTLWLIVVGVFAANFIGAQLNAWLDVRPIEDKTEIGDHDV